MNRVFRKLNLQIAPILLFPLLITALTGIILGLGNRLGILPTVVIDALLVIHQGKFLGEKITPYYVLFLGLGVLIIGLNILIKVRNILISKRTQALAVNIYKILALMVVFPLGVCVETGVAYRLGTDWLDLTTQQTAIFLSLHTGTPLTTILGISYTLVTGFSLILLSIIGVETSLITTQASLSQNELVSSLIPVEQTFESPLTLLDNIALLRKKIRNVIIIFSLIFLVILSLATSTILLSLSIVVIVFTLPALFIAERLIQEWQEQQEIQPQLEDSESESATILRAIPDSMLRITEGGICLSYIPAKDANSFIIRGEIIDQHINEFLDPKIALRFIKYAQLSLKSGLTHSHRFDLPLDNGGRQYYEARISSIGMAEVLIIIRQLYDLNQILVNSEHSLNHSSQDTIFLLSEPELAEILELTLEQIAQNDYHHVICCLVIDDLTIDFDSEATSNLQQDPRLSEILMYQIAAKIKLHLSSDYVARLSDRELVTLVLNCSLDQASVSINKLRKDLNKFSFQWQGNEYPINTSVGLLEINADNDNPTDLLNVIKATCNIAKQKVEIKTFW